MPDQKPGELSISTMAAAAQRGNSQSSSERNRSTVQAGPSSGLVRKAESPAGSLEKARRQKKRGGFLSFLNCCNSSSALESDDSEGPAVPPKEPNGLKTNKSTQNAIPLEPLPKEPAAPPKDPLDQKTTALRDSDKTMVNSDMAAPTLANSTEHPVEEKKPEIASGDNLPEQVNEVGGPTKRDADQVPRLDTNAASNSALNHSNPQVVVQPPSAISATSDATDIELSPATPSGNGLNTGEDPDVVMSEAPSDNIENVNAAPISHSTTAIHSVPVMNQSTQMNSDSASAEIPRVQPLQKKAENSPRTNLPPPPNAPPPTNYSSVRTHSYQSPAQPTIRLLPDIRPELQGRKCLVLDLDETLVHSSFKVGATT